ncbi:MAG: dihydroxy-acid dehydratase [Pseudomonadota bacterium]
MTTPPPRGLARNLTSYADPGFSRFMRRAFLASAGYDGADLERPIVGIVDTSSDFNPCHRDMPALVHAVKRGVLQAGGLPFAFPTASLHEILISPTTMYLRNLVAMETEELLRAQPMDAVVLLGGCDKTVPAQLMAALSADLPAIHLVTGPMRTGSWEGERLGACTDCRRLWAQHRAGTLSAEDLDRALPQLCATGGTCMVMGSASTMACLLEATGLALPGTATAPSGSGARLRLGVATGRRAVELALAGGPTPRSIFGADALHNALTVLSALSGSTNAVVHLAAFARRAGLAFSLDDLDHVSCRTPVLVDCKPIGARYMEDFDQAGGMPALLAALRPLLHLDAPTVAGPSLGEGIADHPGPGAWQDLVRSLDAPLQGPGALRVLRGSLAPRGAVLKAGAATPALCQHRGPALVFDSPTDAAARIDDPDLPVTPQTVLVLRGAGPVGAGMPEAGSLPIPRKLARQGVRDMVRVSDARMSGTAYGTVVLHCAPEAAVGGPLALVRDGDEIALDLAGGRIDLCVSDEELSVRRAAWRPPPLPERGWARLQAQHLLQADEGMDLDFL